MHNTLTDFFALHTFVEAILHLIYNQNVSNKQIKRWIELSKEFDVTWF